MLSLGHNIRDIISLKIPALHSWRKITFPMWDAGRKAVHGKYSQGINIGNVLRCSFRCQYKKLVKIINFACWAETAVIWETGLRITGLEAEIMLGQIGMEAGGSFMDYKELRLSESFYWAVLFCCYLHSWKSKVQKPKPRGCLLLSPAPKASLQPPPHRIIVMMSAVFLPLLSFPVGQSNFQQQVSNSHLTCAQALCVVHALSTASLLPRDQLSIPPM